LHEKANANDDHYLKLLVHMYIQNRTLINTTASSLVCSTHTPLGLLAADAKVAHLVILIRALHWGVKVQCLT